MDVQNSKKTTQTYKALMASRERDYDKKWGSFYEDLKRSRMSMMFNYFFILRKFFFAFILFYWYDMVAVQIIFFILTTEFYLIYFLYCFPFTDKFRNT